MIVTAVAAAAVVKIAVLVVVVVLVLVVVVVVVVAVVIINSPFQPGAFSTGSTTATYKKVPIFFIQSYFKKP